MQPTVQNDIFGNQRRQFEAFGGDNECLNWSLSALTALMMRSRSSEIERHALRIVSCLSRLHLPRTPRRIAFFDSARHCLFVEFYSATPSGMSIRTACCQICNAGLNRQISDCPRVLIPELRRRGIAKISWWSILDASEMRNFGADSDSWKVCSGRRPCRVYSALFCPCSRKCSLWSSVTVSRLLLCVEAILKNAVPK
jgi:hypothetical protein